MVLLLWPEIPLKEHGFKHSIKMEVKDGQEISSIMELSQMLLKIKFNSIMTINVNLNMG